MIMARVVCALLVPHGFKYASVNRLTGILCVCRGGGSNLQPPRVANQLANCASEKTPVRRRSSRSSSSFTDALYYAMDLPQRCTRPSASVFFGPCTTLYAGLVPRSEVV